MELYKKVYIKSEEDLPKEDNEYFVYYKKYGTGSTHIYLGNDARKYTWLNDIDWYLQPIEITDADIEAYYPVTSSHQMDTNSWNNRLRQEGAKAVINGEIKHIE